MKSIVCVHNIIYIIKDSELSSSYRPCTSTKDTFDTSATRAMHSSGLSRCGRYGQSACRASRNTCWMLGTRLWRWSVQFGPRPFGVNAGRNLLIWMNSIRTCPVHCFRTPPAAPARPRRRPARDVERSLKPSEVKARGAAGRRGPGGAALAAPPALCVLRGGARERPGLGRARSFFLFASGRTACPRGGGRPARAPSVGRGLRKPPSPGGIVGKLEHGGIQTLSLPPITAAARPGGPQPWRPGGNLQYNAQYGVQYNV